MAALTDLAWKTSERSWTVEEDPPKKRRSGTMGSKPAAWRWRR
jgi:hypothetical protein